MITNQTFKITNSTTLAAPCWIYHAERGKWEDSASFGNVVSFTPSAFGFTHWRQKQDPTEVIREAVSWVQTRLGIEGHPCPKSFITTALWLEAVEPPKIKP